MVFDLSDIVWVPCNNSTYKQPSESSSNLCVKYILHSSSCCCLPFFFSLCCNYFSWSGCAHLNDVSFCLANMNPSAKIRIKIKSRTQNKVTKQRSYEIV